MNKTSYILGFLGFVLLFGLVLWQINQLDTARQLRQESILQEMKSELFEVAVSLRKKEEGNTALLSSSKARSTFINGELSNRIKKFTKDYSWKIENVSTEIIDTTSRFKTSINNLSVCLSCILLVDVVDDAGIKTQRKDFILKYSPEQMMNLKGIGENDIDYLNLYFTLEYRSIPNYSAPVLFLTGLIILFTWMIYLNTKQNRLIKQKNEFVNHLSHQFQTPLSSIKMGANLLDKNSANSHEIIQIIKTESNRLENHIKTVLHWVKSDADRLTLNKTDISVTDIVEQSIKQMKPVFLKNNTTVNFMPSDVEYHIIADANHLQLMLFNVWENAIKHNEQPITLNITISNNKNHTSIISSDNGVGMQNVQNTIKFKGLGLSYIEKIMKMHKGELILDTKVDKGLSAELKFPNYG